VAVITRLVAGYGRTSKVKVYLDGQYAFSLETVVALEAKLRRGCELSAEQLEKLEQSNKLSAALSAAERLISFRPRSEAELRQNLSRKGISDGIIAKVMDRLRQSGLVDDAAFAHYWAENRAAFRPRGQRLVQAELRAKGVALEVARDATAELDDAESAYLAGLKKAHLLRGHDFNEFSRKLVEYLRRRGYDYDAIKPSIKRLWHEISQG
jgi:regulatory protein